MSLVLVGQGILYMLIAPLTPGLVRWLKAKLLRRQGAHPLQVYFNLWQRFGTQEIRPSNASWIFTAAPYIVFACYALPGFLMPLIVLPQTQTIRFDFLMLVYILGLARFVLVLGGMDSIVPFASLGGSRTMFVYIFIEPALMLAAYVMAAHWYTTDVTTLLLLNKGIIGASVIDAALLLLWVTLAMVVVGETERIPFDEPDSHLELGMLGKALHLAYSGAALALIEWGEAMLLTLLFSIVLNFILPWSIVTAGAPWWVWVFLIVLYPVKLVLMAFVLAVWELAQTKLKVRSVIEPAAIMLIIVVLAIVMEALLGKTV